MPTSRDMTPCSMGPANRSAPEFSVVLRESLR